MGGMAIFKSTATAIRRPLAYLECKRGSDCCQHVNDALPPDGHTSDRSAVQGVSMSVLDLWFSEWHKPRLIRANGCGCGIPVKCAVCRRTLKTARTLRSRRKALRAEIGWLAYLWRRLRYRMARCGKSEDSWIPPALAKRVRTLATGFMIRNGGRWREPRDVSTFTPKTIENMKRAGDPRVDW